jgi:hypothetical protein
MDAHFHGNDKAKSPLEQVTIRVTDKTRTGVGFRCAQRQPTSALLSVTG